MMLLNILTEKKFKIYISVLKQNLFKSLTKLEENNNKKLILCT